MASITGSWTGVWLINIFSSSCFASCGLTVVSRFKATLALNRINDYLLGKISESAMTHIITFGLPPKHCV